MLIRVVSLMLLTLLAAGERGTVVNPQYTSWSKQKLGTSVILRTTTVSEGTSTIIDITETLVEVTDDAVTIDLEIHMAGPVQDSDLLQQRRRIAVPAKVQLEDAKRAQIPGLVSGDIEQTGNETIQAAGKRYKCKVFSFKAEQAGLEYEGEMWRCDDVPGGVVKADIRFNGAATGDMVLVLLSIDRK